MNGAGTLIKKPPRDTFLDDIETLSYFHREGIESDLNYFERGTKNRSCISISPYIYVEKTPCSDGSIEIAAVFQPSGHGCKEYKWKVKK